MKKFFSVLIILILGSVFSLFADPKNIVYAQAFDFNQIDRLNISLTWENLIISQIYGEEISVEIGCNNIKKFRRFFARMEISYWWPPPSI